MIDRAILIAAGRGKRLGPHTEDVPKCMVQVGAKPILGWVWQAFAAAGVKELVVIRGYKGDVLEEFVRGLVPNATFVDNAEWETNNILLSLACARRYLDRPCLLTYSDILFTPAVARAAVESPAELGAGASAPAVAAGARAGSNRPSRSRIAARLLAR